MWGDVHAYICIMCGWYGPFASRAPMKINPYPTPTPHNTKQQVVVGDSMYVLGGGQYSPEEGPMDIHRLDLEHMIWFQHDLGCMAPQARIAHT